MSVMSKASGPHTEVTITGTLSRVDANGIDLPAFA